MEEINKMYTKKNMIAFGEWCENLQKDHKYIRRINPNISTEELFKIWKDEFKNPSNFTQDDIDEELAKYL